MRQLNGIDVSFQNSLAILGDDILYIEKWPWARTDDWWRSNWTTASQQSGHEDRWRSRPTASMCSRRPMRRSAIAVRHQLQPTSLRGTHLLNEIAHEQRSGNRAIGVQANR